MIVFVCRRKRFVALKVVKSALHYTETALDEIKLLRCVSAFLFISPSDRQHTHRHHSLMATSPRASSKANGIVVW